MGRIARSNVCRLLVAIAVLVAAGGPAKAQVVPKAGDLFVAEWEGRLLHVDPSLPNGSNVTQVLPDGSLPSARDLAISPSGELFVSAYSPPPENVPTIYRVDPTTATRSVLTSGGNLVVPSSITVAPGGDIFVLDGGDLTPVIRVNPNTGEQTVVRSSIPPQRAQRHCGRGERRSLRGGPDRHHRHPGPHPAGRARSSG